MAELLYRVKLRSGREFKRLARRPFRYFLTPFAVKEGGVPIIHRCYHKVGTVWFGRVLRDVAWHFGLTFEPGDRRSQIKRYEHSQHADVFLDLGSHVKLGKLEHYRGSHMIRDPRDLVISAYFYHKWTSEKWAHKPQQHLGGKSYQEYLKSLNEDDGLALEIENSKFWINKMSNWSFADPNIYEIKYEEIIRDEKAIFRELFSFYGFSADAVDKSCEIAEKYSFKAFLKKGAAGKSTHLRSGKTGEWRDVFSPGHARQFKSLYPGVLARLGYEVDDNW